MIILEGVKHLKYTDPSATGVLVSFNGVLIGAMSSSQILEATVGGQGNSGNIVQLRRNYQGDLVLRDDAIGSAETETLYGEVAFYCMEPRK